MAGAREPVSIASTPDQLKGRRPSQRPRSETVDDASASGDELGSGTVCPPTSRYAAAPPPSARLPITRCTQPPVTTTWRDCSQPASRRAGCRPRYLRAARRHNPSRMLAIALDLLLPRVPESIISRGLAAFPAVLLVESSRAHPSTFQLCHQARPRIFSKPKTHATLDGSNWQIEHRGDLSMGETAEICQLDDLGLLGGQAPRQRCAPRGASSRRTASASVRSGASRRSLETLRH